MLKRTRKFAGQLLLVTSFAPVLAVPTFAQTYVPPPGGRLTLQSGYPIQAADVADASMIYYDAAPNQAPFVPIPNGLTFVAYPIVGNEISMGLAAANVTLSSAYDVFLLYTSSSALVICIGPGWTVGSRVGWTITHGSFQIHNALGYWTNSTAITHCYGGSTGTTDYGSVAADNALWVGSFLASGSGKVSMVVRPVADPGGNNTYCGLANAYNRVLTRCKSQDSTAEWVSNSTAVNPIPCNSSSSAGGTWNRINFLDPIGDMNWRSDLTLSIVGKSSAYGYFGIVGIGLDTTTGISGQNGDGALLEQQTTGSAGNTGNQFGTAVHASYSPPAPPIGIHYLQCVEYSNGNSIFNGSDYMMLSLDAWM